MDTRLAMRLKQLAATAARDLARVIVPVECPGCGTVDVRWCEDCAAPWWEAPMRCESGAPRLQRRGVALPVWSVTSLESTAHGMVAAWKDGGRRDLDAFFAQAAARCARDIAPELPERVEVVPAPARRSSTRARGVDLPFLLAQAVAAALSECGRDARAVAALSIGAGQSRGASARGRWTQAAGSVERSALALRPGALLLVDDVLTTGATLAACSAALQTPLNPVIGALVLAHASAPARTLTHDVADVRGRV